MTKPQYMGWQWKRQVRATNGTQTAASEDLVQSWHSCNGWITPYSVCKLKSQELQDLQMYMQKF